MGNSTTAEKSCLRKGICQSRFKEHIKTSGKMGWARCYLAEYHSLYGIALIQEYDEEFASICGMDMDTMYQSIRNKAAGLRNRIQLDGMALLTAESYGDHHELIVFMSAYERKERFLQAAALLNKEAYFLAAVTAKPPAAGQEEREENRN